MIKIDYLDSLDMYQKLAGQTAIFPTEHWKAYLSLGLTGEAGEVANKVKKEIRDNVDNRDYIIEELGDVLWYIAVLAEKYGVTLGGIATRNIQKLQIRHETRKDLKELGQLIEEETARQKEQAEQ